MIAEVHAVIVKGTSVANATVAETIKQNVTAINIAKQRFKTARIQQRWTNTTEQRALLKLLSGSGKGCDQGDQGWGPGGGQGCGQ